MLNKNKGNAAKHNYVNLYKVGLTALGVALDLKNCTRPRRQKHPLGSVKQAKRRLNGGIADV